MFETSNWLLVSHQSYLYLFIEDYFFLSTSHPTSTVQADSIKKKGSMRWVTTWEICPRKYMNADDARYHKAYICQWRDNANNCLIKHLGYSGRVNFKRHFMFVRIGSIGKTLEIYPKQGLFRIFGGPETWEPSHNYSSVWST